MPPKKSTQFFASVSKVEIFGVVVSSEPIATTHLLARLLTYLRGSNNFYLLGERQIRRSQMF